MRLYLARSLDVSSPVLDPPCRYSIVVISNQNLKSAALTDWKKKIPQIAAAVRVPQRVLRSLCSSFLNVVLNISVHLGSRPSIPNFCSHSQRWAPEAHARNVVRARAYLCRRGRHNRSFGILPPPLTILLIVSKTRALLIMSEMRLDAPTTLRRRIENLRSMSTCNSTPLK